MLRITDRHKGYIELRSKTGVRLIGWPARDHFFLTYIESSTKGFGHAREAIKELQQRYKRVVVHDPVEDARGFWRKMCGENLVSLSQPHPDIPC